MNQEQWETLDKELRALTEHLDIYYYTLFTNEDGDLEWTLTQLHGRGDSRTIFLFTYFGCPEEIYLLTVITEPEESKHRRIVACGLEDLMKVVAKKLHDLDLVRSLAPPCPLLYDEHKPKPIGHILKPAPNHNVEVYCGGHTPFTGWVFKNLQAAEMTLLGECEAHQVPCPECLKIAWGHKEEE